jgi:hypothetical protein
MIQFTGDLIALRKTSEFTLKTHSPLACHTKRCTVLWQGVPQVRQ